MNRRTLVHYLNDYLRIDRIQDASRNGLQVEGRAKVERVSLAVDACLQTIRATARYKADMLIVHHGLFWSRHEQITGVMAKRVATLMQNGISLYAAHLPLDCHEEVGNNVELIRLFGLDAAGSFGMYNGVEIGCIGESASPLSRRGLRARIEKVMRARPQILAFGPQRIRRVAVCSGGAAALTAEAKDRGCDTFVTGETSHVAYHIAKEAKINVIYAGHYASETVGVKALGRHLTKRFGLVCRFINAPTGY